MVAGIRRSLRTLPHLMRAGLSLSAVGAAVDVAYHVGTGTAGAGHGAIAFTGHIVTLIGMVVTMLGLIGAAFTRRPVKNNPRSQGDNR